MAKIGRNDPCPCGSGKKYKHCCLRETTGPIQPSRSPARARSTPLPVERLIRGGENAVMAGNSVEGCRKWLEAWELVKPHIDGTVRSLGELDTKLDWDVILFNWCQDLELELANAGIQDDDFHRERIRYCREFVELLPDSDETVMVNMLRAEAETYFALGRITDGEAAFQRLEQAFPRSPWAYVSWGDVYSGVFRTPVTDVERAREKYRQALAVAENELDREPIEDRLRNLQRDTAPEQ